MANPCKYTPLELKINIDKYLASRAKRGVILTHRKSGKDFEILEYATEPVTWQGLAVYLGIEYQTLWAYSKKAEYRQIVNGARQLIESNLIDRLVTQRHVTGLIFYLKNNLYWKDNPDAPVDDTPDPNRAELLNNIEGLVSKLGWELKKKPKTKREELGES